jgi:hypothetical protein
VRHSAAVGLNIIIPVVLVAVVVPVAFGWARKTFKGEPGSKDAGVTAARLTSSALRALPAPPWRVVYEIAPERLTGVEHVLIGPAGVFALTTTLDAVPPPSAVGEACDMAAIARGAIARGGLDDALRRCAMSSTGLVTVHWGPTEPGTPPARSIVHGVTAVDGRRLTEWAADLPADVLSPARVDLAWQTVTTAIGRPDPLA